MNRLILAFVCSNLVDVCCLLAPEASRDDGENYHRSLSPATSKANNEHPAQPRMALMTRIKGGKGSRVVLKPVSLGHSAQMCNSWLQFKEAEERERTQMKRATLAAQGFLFPLFKWLIIYKWKYFFKYINWIWNNSYVKIQTERIQQQQQAELLEEANRRLNRVTTWIRSLVTTLVLRTAGFYVNLKML